MVAGVGVDIVDLDRFAAALERTPGLVDRLFTPAEQAYAEGGRRVERYAARFAAKEAALKAMGCGLGACPWHDITVDRADSGAPSLLLERRASELAAERGISRLHLSLSHDGRSAIAFVVAD